MANVTTSNYPVGKFPAPQRTLKDQQRRVVGEHSIGPLRDEIPRGLLCHGQRQAEEDPSGHSDWHPRVGKWTGRDSANRASHRRMEGPDAHGRQW